MPDTQLGFPVLLEDINADLTVGTNIGVEDFGEEVALGWCSREVLPQDQLHAEHTASIWGPLCHEKGEGVRSRALHSEFAALSPTNPWGSLHPRTLWFKGQDSASGVLHPRTGFPGMDGSSGTSRIKDSGTTPWVGGGEGVDENRPLLFLIQA